MRVLTIMAAVDTDTARHRGTSAASRLPRSPARGRGAATRSGGPDTGNELIDALLMAGHRVRTATDTRLRADGLSLPRLKVLRLLASGPLSMGQVSALLEVAPRSTTDLVDGMAEAGLLERRPHPTDRRSVLLALTDEGATRLAQARAQANEVAAWATRKLPAGSRGRLIELLGCIGAPDGDDPIGAGTHG